MSDALEFVVPLNSPHVEELRDEGDPSKGRVVVSGPAPEVVAAALQNIVEAGVAVKCLGDEKEAREALKDAGFTPQRLGRILYPGDDLPKEYVLGKELKKKRAAEAQAAELNYHRTK